jgi:endonuclease YncB( thermonuclease family)
MARKERVVRVIDGDTFMTSSRKNPVRLANVDAPERGQRGYVKATTTLNRMISGKEVAIDTKARDSYGRSVAEVKIGGTSVNRVMKTITATKKTSHSKK